MPNKAGFTLVEIIVASVVFALTIAGLLGVFVAGSRHIIHARERVTSAELGKLFIDPLQLDVRQDTWVGNSLDPLVPHPPVTQTVNNTVFTCNYIMDDATSDSALVNTDLRRVTATIAWNELSP